MMPCPSSMTSLSSQPYLFPPVARSLMWRAVMPSSLHLWATSWAANMAAYGEDSSRSAFTFIPPVTRQMVSLGTKAQDPFFLTHQDSECISHPKDKEHFCPRRAEDESLSEQASWSHKTSLASAVMVFTDPRLTMPQHFTLTFNFINPVVGVIPPHFT